MRKNKLLCGILLIMLFMVSFLKANTITSTSSGGVWGKTGTWVGNVVPANTDDVVIATTGTNSVQADESGISYTCNKLTINDGASLTIYRNFTVTTTTSITGTINFGSTSSTQQSMTFTGAVTLNIGAVWNETTTGTAALFLFSNSFTNNSTTFIAQSPVHTFSGTTMTISGSTITSIPSVTISGTYTNSGTLTITTALVQSGTGTLTNGANGTLNINCGTITNFTSSKFTASASGNTVNYGYSGSQTVININYYNLTLSNSGTKSLQTGTTSIAGNLILSGSATATTVVNFFVGGNLSIGDGTTLTAAAFTLTVTGTTTVGGGTSGTLSISSATGAKSFSGAVTINSGGAITESAAAALTFGSDVTNSGTLIENGTAVVGIAGCFTNNGTYTTSTGIHTFSGSSKTISGTLNIPSVTVSGTYTNNGTITVTTALAGGTLTNGTSGILNINFTGAPGITTLTTSATGNTVNYGYAGTQTIITTTYYNLTLSGSGSKSFSAGLTITGTLSISGAIAALFTGSSSTANYLFLGGNEQSSGTYGSTNSSASNQNSTYFGTTSTGILTVGTSTTGCSTWKCTGTSDWGTAGNWKNNIVPVTAMDVVIPSGGTQPTISSTAVCNNLTINSGAVLTINSSIILTVNGSLIIQSTSSGTGSLITSSTFSNVTVQRYMTISTSNYSYHYLSSPITLAHGSNIINLSADAYGNSVNNQNAYECNELSGCTWKRYPIVTGDELTPGYGYAVPYKNSSGNYTLSFTGTLNTGSIQPSIAAGNNLLGNPYPCAISISSFLGDNSLLSGVYLWDDDNSGGTTYSTSDYASCTGSGGCTSNRLGHTVNGNIATGQGFMSISSGTGNANFTNPSTVNNNNQFFSYVPDTNNQIIRLDLVNDTNSFNQLIINFNPTATKGFDHFYDCKKIIGNPNIAFYSLMPDDTNIWAIQGLPYENPDTIKLGYSTSYKGNHTIKLGGLENIDKSMKIFLEDLNN